MQESPRSLTTVLMLTVVDCVITCSHYLLLLSFILLPIHWLQAWLCGMLWVMGCEGTFTFHIWAETSCDCVAWLGPSCSILGPGEQHVLERGCSFSLGSKMKKHMEPSPTEFSRAKPWCNVWKKTVSCRKTLQSEAHLL